MPSRLTLRVPADFELKRAVCSYGYFLLAPNQWRPAEQTLCRPLVVGDEPVGVTLTQPGGPGSALRVTCDATLDRGAQQRVRAAVTRMLRIDEDLTAWRRLSPAARRRGFGRMFRSPTMFEDLVKTITGCNVTWRNTISMNRHLVDKVGKGAFPTPAQLARLTPSRLKASCRVGYRAGRIINLARAFERGDVDPDWFEHPERDTLEIRARLLELDGIGPYAAANMLQLLGHYDHLPIDTETYRHYCHVTGAERPKNDKLLDPLIHARYDPLAPYQFLAYWFEIWRDYERRYGDAWNWDPATTGSNFTAAVLNK